MDNEREIIHKILDGDADENERKRIAQGMEADPEVREEITGLMNAVRALEESERREPPLSFTAEVMRKISPAPRPTMLERMREFLFGGRVLRWNMASALAAVAVVIALFVAVSRIHEELPPLPGNGRGSVTVRLTFYAPQARTVAVAGDFNKWKTDADPMRRTDGMWSIELHLTPGVYAYNFIVDGTTWVSDPGAAAYRDDGFGSRNAVMRVKI
jgi:anti-sigma factor RsiW